VEPENVKLENGTAVLNKHKTGHVLEHLIAKSTNQAGDDHKNKN